MSEIAANASQVEFYSGWVFSKKADWILFLLLPALTFLIVAVLFHGRSYGEVPVLVTTFFLTIDSGHLYSTIFGSYFNQHQRRAHPRILWLAPLVCFLGMFLSLRVSPALTFRILTFFISYHVTKQQVGWLSITSRGLSLSAWQRFFDRSVIYAVCLGSFVIKLGHLSPDDAYWYTGDLFVLSAGTTKYLELALPVLMGGYFLNEVFRMITNRTGFKGRHLVMLTTCLFWYVPLVVLSDLMVYFWTLNVNHGLPYVFFVQRTGSRLDGSILGILNPIKQILTVVAVCLILAHFDLKFWHLTENDPIKNLSDLSNPGRIAFMFLVALVWIPVLTHCLLDGFLWRFSRDETLTSATTSAVI